MSFGSWIFYVVCSFSYHMMVKCLPRYLGAKNKGNSTTKLVQFSYCTAHRYTGLLLNA